MYAEHLRSRLIEVIGPIATDVAAEMLDVCNELAGCQVCEKAWNAAVAYWRTLPSDPGARYDATVRLDAGEIAPNLTWGTSPEDVVPITGVVPDPDSFADASKREAARKSLEHLTFNQG